MSEIRITHALDKKLNHVCDGMHISRYTLQEVMMPANRKTKARKAISVIIEGRNFKSVAQPLSAYVGKIPVKYLQIAPDERSIEGILLEEPEAEQDGEIFIDVILGDQDHARHPTAYKKSMIIRIE